MKVLVFSGYGDSSGTPKMREIMKKHSGIRSRVGEIIDYVEENRYLFFDENSFEKKVIELMRGNDDVIVEFIKYENKYYYKSPLGYMSTFSIIDVDTTRPWTIKDYDGAEYIKYLDENKLVDEELNYWEEI